MYHLFQYLLFVKVCVRYVSVGPTSAVYFSRSHVFVRDVFIGHVPSMRLLRMPLSRMYLLYIFLLGMCLVDMHLLAMRLLCVCLSSICL